MKMEYCIVLKVDTVENLDLTEVTVLCGLLVLLIFHPLNVNVYPDFSFKFHARNNK